jgi:hypothetical protein
MKIIITAIVLLLLSAFGYKLWRESNDPFYKCRGIWCDTKHDSKHQEHNGTAILQIKENEISFFQASGTIYQGLLSDHVQFDRIKIKHIDTQSYSLKSATGNNSFIINMGGADIEYKIISNGIISVGRSDNPTAGVVVLYYNDTLNEYDFKQKLKSSKPDYK